MKTFRLFFFTTMTSFSLCHAQITPANQIEDVIECFKQADLETLAIFDIDMVILQPEEPAFQMANMKQHSHVIKKVMKQLPADKRDIFLVLTSIGSRSVLIDTRIPKLLNELTERKIPKIALTGNLTGSFAHIDDMENWKIQRLAELGIDFSNGAPYLEEIDFDELPSFRQQLSRFMKGILFVNGSICPKGEALIAFLKRSQCSPKKVIFIDDREENLKSVESALLQFDPCIEFKGLHFTGAKDYPSPSITEENFEKRWQEVVKLAEATN